ncbi:MAG: toxin glutamine deamidase domain-containing protein [Acidimicrobiales bacterium]
MNSLLLALGLVLVDRWPHRLGDARLWKINFVAQAFDYRWSLRPAPPAAQRWVERMARVESGTVAQTIRGYRHRQVQRLTSRHPGDPRMTNLGPGPRTKNTMQVALAVDARLDGCATTAMPWSESGDPVLEISVDRVARTQGVVGLASTRQEAQRIAESWGPGAKGVVSVRDPGHPSHHLFNVVNRGGDVAFLDYSTAVKQSRIGGLSFVGSPEDQAECHLANIDEAFAFPSVRIWRTQNIPGRSRLRDDLLCLDFESLRSAIDASLPETMSSSDRDLVAARIATFGSIDYAVWFIEQITRGACTLLPGDFGCLAGQGQLEVEPLTALDRAVLTLADDGHVRLVGQFVEITTRDTQHNRDLASLFLGATLLTELVDGLAWETFEVRIDHKARERLREPLPVYSPPAPGKAQAEPAPPRRHSWADSNRVLSPGTRKTNCWNTAASVAEYLESGATSSSLPIYREAPFRPTIREYLQLMNAGPTVFVADKHDCDHVVSAWPAHSHGLVVAALSESSTHIFNVYFDGCRVRYLDGHVGVDGDFNFDIRWQRIGVVRLGAMASFDLSGYQATSLRNGGSAPAREHVIAAAVTAR